MKHFWKSYFLDDNNNIHFNIDQINNLQYPTDGFQYKFYVEKSNSSYDYYIYKFNFDHYFFNKRSMKMKLYGDYFLSNLNLLENDELIPIKYCDENGNVNLLSNPNGSINNIAGIFNSNKNILGMMPHPERMSDKLLAGEDCLGLFLSLMN